MQLEGLLCTDLESREPTIHNAITIRQWKSTQTQQEKISIRVYNYNHLQAISPYINNTNLQGLKGIYWHSNRWIHSNLTSSNWSKIMWVGNCWGILIQIKYQTHVHQVSQIIHNNTPHHKIMMIKCHTVTTFNDNQIVSGQN